jgi:uncharacterized HhH-GPD family protein
MTQIAFTDAPEANELLATNRFALLVGMTLYQQVPVEKAFAGPYVLQQRLGRPLDAGTVASIDPQELESLFREKPALHRFPANMAKRTHAVANFIVDEYGGDVSGLWNGVDTAPELFDRITKMPGFGDYKTKVYAAVLARQFDIKPDGWDENLPDWPNISEVTSPEGLTDMKARKKAWKAAQS